MQTLNNVLIFAIDPGTDFSGFCIAFGSDLKPLKQGKIQNSELYSEIQQAKLQAKCSRVRLHVVIEMIASYGMPVGREVFDTCVWIGRLAQYAEDLGAAVDFIYRQEEKQSICHSSKANDATIKQALIDRFAYKVPNKGKGTKKEPGWFYGFKADVWQAYAVLVTYAEKLKNQ